MLDQLEDEEDLYLADKVNLPVYFLSVSIVKLTYWLVEGDFLLVERVIPSELEEELTSTGI